MNEQTAESVPVDLRADGVLWAINRTLFHPRGFALAVNTPDGSLSLMGDGSEPWQYGSPVDEDRLFADFEALLDRARTRATPPGADR
jgi:hypothetical protein